MNPIALRRLGWKPCFQNQMTLEEFETFVPLRIAEVQRSVLFALGESGRVIVNLPTHERWSEQLAVGDWLLGRPEGEQFYLHRLLERDNGLMRKAAGPAVAAQMLAANLDTVFILSSCVGDFSVNRIERYLALVLENHIEPVVVLTKADLADDLPALLDSLPPGHTAIAIDARSAEQASPLARFLTEGATIAVLGSSGVGKSTLANTLLGAEQQVTRAVRDFDGHGRHTTTARQIVTLPQGALLIDTPGMRELQLPAVEGGLSAMFADIEALGVQCRFADCAHRGEPGCAVQAALDSGELDARRYDNYRKMLREQAFHDRELRNHWQVTAARRRFSRTVRARMNMKDKVRHSGLESEE